MRSQTLLYPCVVGCLGLVAFVGMFSWILDNYSLTFQDLFIHYPSRGGCRIFENGGRGNLGLHAKKGGPALGPMLKSLHCGQRGGGV